MQEEFEVQNIKCGGCIDTIRKGINEINGITQVTANLDGEVLIEGDELDRAALAAKLAELGFPET